MGLGASKALTRTHARRTQACNARHARTQPDAARANPPQTGGGERAPHARTHARLHDVPTPTRTAPPHARHDPHTLAAHLLAAAGVPLQGLVDLERHDAVPAGGLVVELRGRQRLALVRLLERNAQLLPRGDGLGHAPPARKPCDVLPCVRACVRTRFETLPQASLIDGTKVGGAGEQHCPQNPTVQNARPPAWTRFILLVRGARTRCP